MPWAFRKGDRVKLLVPYPNFPPGTEGIVESVSLGKSNYVVVYFKDSAGNIHPTTVVDIEINIIPRFLKGDRVETSADQPGGMGYLRGEQGTVTNFQGANGLGRPLYMVDLDKRGPYSIPQDRLMAVIASLAPPSAPFNKGDIVILNDARPHPMFGSLRVDAGALGTVVDTRQQSKTLWGISINWDRRNPNWHGEPDGRYYTPTRFVLYAVPPPPPNPTGVIVPKFQIGDRVRTTVRDASGVALPKGTEGIVVKCDGDFRVNYGPYGIWWANENELEAADQAVPYTVSGTIEFGSVPIKKETNDGRDNCRWCGEKTKAVGLLGGSKMRVCPKCELGKK